MNKVLLTKEQQDLIKTGSMLTLKDGSTWYYLPYWFKSTGDPNLFEMNILDHLPVELKEAIHNMRTNKRRRKIINSNK